ncbi:hypothetical protein ACTFIW_005790 [Dictyostelium discoideum]
MKTETATVVSLNAGIQGGKSLKNTFRSQISADLFLDNKSLAENIILCFQEIDRDFQDYKNYGNLKNKTSSLDKSKKENQLRIIYNNSNLKVIEEVKVNNGTRLQIVSFKLNDVYFVVINCHIPQKKSKEKAFENFYILEKLISKLNKKNIPFLIAGDINHEKKDIKEKLGDGISFVNNNDTETTTGNNSIDHIMYSSHNQSSNFQVLKKVTTSTEEARINHYAIRSKFTLKKGIKLYKGDIQKLYDRCYKKLENHPAQQINVKEEKSRKNQTQEQNQNQNQKQTQKQTQKQNQKQNITTIENEITNNELVLKVKSKFTKENKTWYASQFHRKYFNGVKCSYRTLLRFIKGETNNYNCKTTLINYLNNNIKPT